MEHQHQQYTCPMHPEIIQDKPGNCPKCGMSLVPVLSKPDQSSFHHKPGEHIHTMEDSHRTYNEKLHEELIHGTGSFMKYTCPMHPQIIQDDPGKCPLWV